MRHVFYILLVVLVSLQCRQDAPDYITQFPGKPEVNQFIKEEHEHLLEQMEKLVQTKDSTRQVAKRILELMRHHFQEEEDYVLPPLRALPALASGMIPEHSSEIIRLTEKLKSQLSHINAEHQMIMVHLRELKLAVAYDSLPDVTLLEEQVHKHARAEEEVYFPAAILIGEYLKGKRAPHREE